MPRDEIITYWSQADDGFIAEVPELPGRRRKDYKEALANVEIIIQEWIETAKEFGRPISAPPRPPCLRLKPHPENRGVRHAALARTSRTRVTAILNRNTKAVSTDLLLRVLYALGYTAKITFKSAA